MKVLQIHKDDYYIVPAHLHPLTPRLSVWPSFNAIMVWLRSHDFTPACQFFQVLLLELNIALQVLTHTQRKTPIL